jgi:hypothetical protein
MPEYNAAMVLAVRVLDAISSHRKPDPLDIVLLRGYAPQLGECDSDELAREVIEDELERLSRRTRYA